jgi:predicted transcriptional regulator YdeE
MQNNTFQELLKHMDNWGVLALSYGYNPETSTFKYMIGIKSETEVEGFEKVEYKDKMFAEFKAVGPLPKSLQDTIQKVHKNWIKESIYKYDYEPEIEIYSNGDSSSEAYESYYLLPIKNK